MTTSTTPTPQDLSLELSLLSVEDILGKAPSLAEITAQLADPSKRAKRVKRKSSPKRRTFAPPIATPPRGPDLQMSVREQSFTDHLKGDLAYYKNKARIALFTAEYNQHFLTKILSA